MDSTFAFDKGRIMENSIINIAIDNSAGTATIDIEGTIGMYSDNGATTFEAFKSKVAEINAANSRKVVVNIRSTGGDVQDALLIYEALTALKARVETICYGYTASAATIIAQAASEGGRKMSANGLYLIHRSRTNADGDVEALSTKADLLRKTDDRIANIYAQRSGRSAEEFVSLMAENNGNGRWLTAQEALDAGLIDEIVGASKISNDEYLEVLGLPELPQINTQMEDTKPNDATPSVKQRFFEWLGITDKAAEADFEERIAAKEVEVQNITTERDELKVSNEALVADNQAKAERIAELEAEVQNLSTALAEVQAMKVTATEPAQQVQDPDPTPQPKAKTANETSYEADAKKFK